MKPKDADQNTAINRLVRKNQQYRTYLEEYKKQLAEYKILYKNALRDSTAVKAIQENNAAIVKENATLKQTVSTQEKDNIQLKDELATTKEYLHNLSQNFDKYRESVQDKILKLECERKAPIRTIPGLSDENIAALSLRIWNEIGQHFDGVFTRELKNATNPDSRKSHRGSEKSSSSVLELRSPVMLTSPPSQRISEEAAPDSLRRFVTMNGPPKFASTPVRSGPTQAPPNNELEDLADLVITSEQVQSAASLRLPVIRPTKNNQNNHNIPTIAEETEDETSVETSHQHEHNVPLPPLKPKPSRSAPVKSATVKKNNTAVAKQKSRSKARTPSSNAAKQEERVITKLHNGRVEARVCSSVLKDASEEKRSRSRNKHLISPKKAEPSVYDLSFSDNISPAVKVARTEDSHPHTDAASIEQPSTFAKVKSRTKSRTKAMLSAEANQDGNKLQQASVEAFEGETEKNEMLSETQKKKHTSTESTPIQSPMITTEVLNQYIPISEDEPPPGNKENVMEVDDPEVPASPVITTTSHKRPKVLANSLRKNKLVKENRPLSPEIQSPKSDEAFPQWRSNFDTRSRHRRNALVSYAEPKLNVKMRKYWDEGSQQFIVYEARK